MLKEVNNLLRFSIEVVTLGLIVASSLKINNFILKITISTIMPVIIIIFWSHYMAPRSPSRLPELARVIAEVGLFGSTAFLSFLSFSPKICFIYSAIVTINTVLDHILA